MKFRVRVLSKMPSAEFTVVTFQPIIDDVVFGGKLVLDIKGPLVGEYERGMEYEFGTVGDFLEDVTSFPKSDENPPETEKGKDKEPEPKNPEGSIPKKLGRPPNEKKPEDTGKK